MTRLVSLVPLLLALALSPLLVVVIQRTKALFAGRRGPPLLQPYYDLARLLRKGAVYSRTTTWVFRLAPSLAVATAAFALLVVPFGGVPSLSSFPGDFVLFAGLFALGRFFLVLAALDTGSAFEGMGASREVQIAALSEPALLLALAVLCRSTGATSLSEIAATLPQLPFTGVGPAVVLVSSALAIIILAENARIPFDDPATHLELTMIHEVMILDHSGPDLGFLLYGAALKVWAMSALLVSVLLPYRTGSAPIDILIGAGGIFALAVAIGVVESSMARLRLVRIPQLLASATVLSLLALVLVLSE